MTYQNKNELLELLKTANIRTKKSLGQNFLTSEKALRDIINSSDLNIKDFVIEIGPGLGILTEELAKKAGRVKSYEFDESLIPVLHDRLKDHKNVEIIHGDALRIPLPSEPYKLVANIPYYITSPILMHFLYPKSEKEKRPTKIVLLVQKEVAEKVCSARRDHSVLSLQVQIFGKPEIAGIVKKDCFHPAPKVDSAILKITTYQNPLVDDVELFLRTIKFAFAQRRKILLNSLKNGFHLTKDEIDKILLQAKISPAIRPQELEIADWQRLINILKHSL